ncbi:polymorphic toxin type 33 domain-containing protein [Chryseobacterium koreense]
MEKKLPGKGLDPDTGIWHWDVVVYDNQDRPVMTQDGNLKKNNRWLFTKYDKFGRPAYTGTTDDSRPRSSIQGKLDSLGGNNTERTTGGTAYGSGVILLYDNLSSKNFPNSITELFSISYYDTYPAGSPPMPATILSQDVLQQNAQSSSVSTKGMPTASMVKNLGEAKWTKTYIWYDTRGRNIGTDGVNHLGGYTRIKTQLDFSGVPIETQTYHKRSSASAETTIAEYFTYDHQNRLAKHEHSVNGATPEVLSDNTYNELGWLTIKKLGNSIEEIRYSYNVRGWMTGINLDSGGNFQAGKLFNYKINYNDPVKAADFPEPDVELKVRSRWNGNIAEVFWKNDQDADTKKYGFAYDGLDRLLVGVFRNPLNPGSMEHSEWPSYDLNGNILSMKRTSYVLDTAASVIDDLQYTYSGNRVIEIVDDSQDGNGYEGGGNPIAYDANGNMADMKDKQINAINYNVLNLPEHMSIGSGKRKAAISHTYRADGVKLAKSYTHIGMGALGNMVTVTDVTDYLDGFQYLEVIAPLGRPAEPSGQDLEAAMEREAFTVEELAAIPPGGGNTENAVLQFVPTAEGFYSFTENRYIYQYKDHLGNVRVSFTKNQSGGTDVLDTNDYYPFGMNHLNPDQESFFGASSYKNYKFGGKELQETGFYDFGARFYMSDIAIFGTHDPMSEKTMQPYAYAYNNPMKFADPTGMEGEESSSSESGSETGTGGSDNTGGSQQKEQRQKREPVMIDIGYGIKVASGSSAINSYDFSDNYESDDHSKGNKENSKNEGDPEKGKKGSDGKTGRNPKQDKKLSPGEIKKLQEAGWKHSDKGVNAKGGGPKDLWKDNKGNVYEKPKNGIGPGEPIGINLNNLSIKVTPVVIGTTVIYGTLKFIEAAASRLTPLLMVTPMMMQQINPNYQYQPEMH